MKFKVGDKLKYKPEYGEYQKVEYTVLFICGNEYILAGNNYSTELRHHYTTVNKYLMKISPIKREKFIRSLP